MLYTKLYDQSFNGLIEVHFDVKYIIAYVLTKTIQKVQDNKVNRQMKQFSASLTININNLILSQYSIQPDRSAKFSEDIEPYQPPTESFQQRAICTKIPDTPSIPELTEMMTTKQTMKKSISQKKTKNTTQSQHIYPIDPNNCHQDETDDKYRMMHEYKQACLEKIQSNEDKIKQEQKQQQLKLDEVRKKYQKVNFTYDYDGKILIVDQVKKQGQSHSFLKMSAKVLKKKTHRQVSNRVAAVEQEQIVNTLAKTSVAQKLNFQEIRMTQGIVNKQQRDTMDALTSLNNIQKIKILMHTPSLKLTQEQYISLKQTTHEVNRERAKQQFNRNLSVHASKSQIISGDPSPMMKPKSGNKSPTKLQRIRSHTVSQQGTIKIARNSQVETLLVEENTNDHSIQLSEQKPLKKDSIAQPAYLLFSGNPTLPVVKHNQQRHFSPRQKKMNELIKLNKTIDQIRSGSLEQKQQNTITTRRIHQYTIM